MKPRKLIQAPSFILSCFSLIIFLYILASINEVRLHNIVKFSQSTSTRMGILIGILRLPDQYHKRHFLRLIYRTQSPVGARIDMKFIFCNLTKEDQKVLVALEIMRYDDIIILNCTGNMNKGKAYTYFSSVPEILVNDTDLPDSPYHYVMKGDDDSYFRLQNLVDLLMPLPRQDLYYGYVVHVDQ